MDKKIKDNLEHSIVFLGPCGVGKSLMASTVSKRTKIPLLDINDLITCIYLDLRGYLSTDKKKQKNYYLASLKYLKDIQSLENLTNEETIYLKKFLNQDIENYNYYHKLLNGFEDFHKDYIHRTIADNKKSKGIDLIQHTNSFTLDILKKIYKKTDTPFIIAMPASFGWYSDNPFHTNVRPLEARMHNLLKNTNTVLLQPGVDYKTLSNTDYKSVNNRLLSKHMENYYKSADLEVSTSGIYNDPPNGKAHIPICDGIKELCQFEKLKNLAEIKSLSDQIITSLNDLHKIK